MNHCCICKDRGQLIEATHTCNELKRPVCSSHMRYCIEEGHGAEPLAKVERGEISGRIVGRQSA